MTYKAIYKCRLCGQTYCDGTRGDYNAAVDSMAHVHLGLVSIDPRVPTRTTTHACGGNYTGSMGVADFQGWEKEGQE